MLNAFLRWFAAGLPEAASSYAGQIDDGIAVIQAAMFVIFVLWGIFFAYLIIRYRKRDGAKAEREQGTHTFKSLLPDIIVMCFEIGLIAFYAIPVWSRIKIDFPNQSADPVDIRVVAQQFAWNVRYPGADGKFGRTDPKLVTSYNPIGLDRSDPAALDDVVLANEIHMPLNKTTLVHLSSLDVIHSFSVPEFRIKQDAVPGMTIPMWMKPIKTGTYELACAQLCGFAHSLMKGEVVVQTPADYAAWLKQMAPAKPQPASSGGNF